MMNKAIVALGSNIDPEYHIPYSLKAIDEKFSILEMSEFHYTKPLLYEDQADFLNGSVLIETDLSRENIEKQLKRIENEMGRDRSGKKSGPRKIDLDIVVFNGKVVDDDVYERKFLRSFIKDLVPDFEFRKKNK